MPEEQTEIKEPTKYQYKAKYMVNMLFDKGYLADNLARTAIDLLEEHIAYVLERECNMAVKINELNIQSRDLKARKVKNDG